MKSVIDAAFNPEQVNLRWEVGDVILGEYRVGRVAEGTTRHYAEGGMGRVYRVRHLGWGIDLAAKVPRPETLDSMAHRDAFINECQTWVKLAPHPHVVPCYYVRSFEEVPVVFAEFVEGGSLSHWISSGQLYGGGHSRALERMLDIAIQTAWGLHHSHQQGLVHQDMKPGNVMMASDGTAMITDFGLAQARAVGGGRAGATGPVKLALGHSFIVPGAGFMSKEYASPEQLEGRPLTRRSDLWSWAVSVLEMFAGGLTWRSGRAAPEVLQQCRQNGPESHEIPPIPGLVGDLLAKCLCVDLDLRFADMAMVAVRLREIYAQVTGAGHGRPIPKLMEIRASGFNNKALSLLDLGDEPGARHLLTQAIRTTSLHAESTYNLGLLDWRGGHLTDDAFLAKLKAICNSSPGDWLPTFLTSLVHSERGDRSSAAKLMAHPLLDKLVDLRVHEARQRAENLPHNSGCCLKTLRSPQEGLTALVMGKQDQSLLSSGFDHTVCWWNLRGFNEGRILAKQRSPVVGLVACRDGQTAIAACQQGELLLWDMVTGRCQRVVETYQGSVRSIAATPDGNLACVTRDDNNVWLYDMQTGGGSGSLTGHRAPVTSLQVTADGLHLVSVSWDGTLVVWDLLTRKIAKWVELQAGKLQALALSLDGRSALVGCENGRIKWVDIFSGSRLATLQGHGACVRCLAFAPDGRLAASGSDDKTVRLWAVATGRCLRTFEGHEHPVSAVVFAPGGRTLYSGGSDATICCWELSTGPRSPFAISRPQSVLAQCSAVAGHRDKLLRARRAMETGDIGQALQLITEARQIPELAQSRKALDLMAAVGRFGRRTHLSQALPQSLARQMDSEVTCLAVEPNDRHATSLCGCESDFLHRANLWRQVGMQIDQRRAMAGCRNGDVIIIGLDRSQLTALENQQGAVRSVAFLPGGLRCRVWPRLGSPRTYDPRGGQRVPDEHHLNPPGQVLATDGAIVPPPSDFIRSPSSLAESWDGRWRFTCDNLSSLTLTDLSSACRPLPFAADAASIAACAAITADGRHGFSAGRDAVVRIWKLPEGQCIQQLPVTGAPVTCIACSVDARWLLAGAEDGTLWIWELVWKFDFPGWSDWTGDAQPYANAFLKRTGITRLSEWTAQLQCCWLLDLQCVGFGWIRPEEALAAMRRLLQEKDDMTISSRIGPGCG